MQLKSNLQSQRDTYTPSTAVFDGTSPGIYYIQDYLSAGYVTMVNDLKEYRDHIVTQEELGLPDAIAHKHYGDADLWWVICYYNGIIDPLNDMKIGAKIKVPNIQSAGSFFSRARPEKTASRIGSLVRL